MVYDGSRRIINELAELRHIGNARLFFQLLATHGCGRFDTATQTDWEFTDFINVVDVPEETHLALGSIYHLQFFEDLNGSLGGHHSMGLLLGQLCTDQEVHTMQLMEEFCKGETVGYVVF